MDATVVNPVTVLNAIPANSQVNIQGLYLNMQNSTAIEDFLDLLDTMRGVSREKNASGEWMYHDYDDAQVSGEIHTAALTGAQIASYKARYPYINFTADSTLSYLAYASYDGATTYKVVECHNGVPQESAPSNPSRASSAQYDYTFIGWSKSQNATTADADAETGVVADRTIYAAYSVSTRTYTVRFYNGSTLLETDTGVPYGGSTTYDGATPVSPDGSATDYPFEGWLPTPTNIQGDTSCYAQFGSPVEDAEITDSWDTIIANIDNGTYKTAYKIGNYKPLDLGTKGTVNMQIVAIDEDELASGSKAPITFISKELIGDYVTMNNTASSAGGWENTVFRNTYLAETIMPLIPTTVKARLQSVKKLSTFIDSGQQSEQTTYDKVWIPSYGEVFESNESSSTYRNLKESFTYNNYKKIYSGYDHRKLKVVGSDSYSGWWLRTSDSYGSGFLKINTDGKAGRADAWYQNYVCLGFCLGLEAET